MRMLLVYPEEGKQTKAIYQFHHVLEQSAQLAAIQHVQNL